MATKTISIDLEAYARLAGSRLSPNESFSKVIKRARWDTPQKSAGALLAVWKNLPAMSSAMLDSADKRQGQDKPPEDPWHQR